MASAHGVLSGSPLPKEHTKVAHLMWPRVDVGIPEMYILVPESLADHERFGGMLFTEEELEALP